MLSAILSLIHFDFYIIHIFVTDPPKVTGMHLVKSSPTSLSLSWTVSRRAKPSATRYELMYRKKVRSTALSDLLHNEPQICFTMSHNSKSSVNKFWYQMCLLMAINTFIHRIF